jgi:hypothetical protein
VSENFHGRRLQQHLALAARRVVFREVVRGHKREHRKGGENHEEYPGKFHFHGVLIE